MKLTPYWLDTAPTFFGPEKRQIEGDYDVAVVGGGFTGLSASIALDKNGASVVHLEADRLGSVTKALIAIFSASESSRWWSSLASYSRASRPDMVPAVRRRLLQVAGHFALRSAQKPGHSGAAA